MRGSRSRRRHVRVRGHGGAAAESDQVGPDVGGPESGIGVGDGGVTLAVCPFFDVVVGVVSVTFSMNVPVTEGAALSTTTRPSSGTKPVRALFPPSRTLITSGPPRSSRARRRSW